MGIAGGSGSGKTTFITRIKNLVSHPRFGVLHQDAYYLAVPNEELIVNGKRNFDHPEAFDWALLRKHIQTLREGGSVAVPVYDYSVSKRSKKTEKLGPCDVVALEGIFALWDPEIRELLNLKIFMDVDADVRFIRRLHRDVKERGRTFDSVIEQYYDIVRPMHTKFIQPTASYANVIVGEENEPAAHAIVSRIRELLNQGTA